jgi:ATP-dependent Zn protease
MKNEDKQTNVERVASGAKAQLWATAYHEAGHALADYRLGFKIKSVTIKKTKDSAGSVKVTFRLNPRALNFDDVSSAARAKWHDRIVSALAGREAQRRYKPQSIRLYMAEKDRRAVVDFLWRLHPEPLEMKAVLEYLKRRTHNLVGHEQNWAMITALASALMQRQTLSAKEVKAVFCGSFQEQMRLHRQAQCDCMSGGEARAG